MLAQCIKQGTYTTLVYGASAVVARLLHFALFGHIVHTLGVASYGVWDFYQTIFYFLGSMLSSCASSALMRFYLADTQSDQQKKVLGTSCWIIMGTIGIWWTVSVTFLVYGTHVQTPYALLTVCNSGLQALLYFVLTYYKSTNAVWWYAILFNLQQLVMLLLLRCTVGMCATTLLPLFGAVTLSLLCIVPCFVTLFWQHHTCDYSLIKQQLRFSLPLLLVGISTVCFISVDRYFLKLCSAQLLGHYAIIMRFGSLFQFCALALTDAWPIIIFNACRTPASHNLVGTLTTYYLFVLMSLAVCMNGLSLLLCLYIFPDLYPQLACYIPWIFLAALLYETARVLQASFAITYQTTLSALLAYGTLLLQIMGCWLATKTSAVLSALIGANCLTFLCYSISSYLCMTYYAAAYRVSLERLIRGTMHTCLYLFLSSVTITTGSPLWCMVLALSWPCTVWLFLLSTSEKEWLVQYCIKLYTRGTIPEHQQLAYTSTPYYAAHTHERIALFGVCPPPWGGISVHITRLKKVLEQQGNTVACFDTERHKARHIVSQLYQLLRFVYAEHPTLMYYHSPYIRLSFVHLIVLRCMRLFTKSKVVVVEHDCRYLASRSGVWKKLYSFSLRCVHELVFIGQPTYDSYCQNHLYIPRAHSIHGAFIPPDTTTYQTIMETYPPDLMRFMQEHTPCITGNASNVLITQGYDLYGFDMMIDLVSALRTSWAHIGCVVAVSSISDKAYWRQIQARIAQRGLEKYFYFLVGTYEYWPIIQHADLFVRPTRNENFGISVAEAIYLGIPALASDVCARPAGTVLFQAGNHEDFLAKSLEILRTPVEQQSHIPAHRATMQHTAQANRANQ